MTETINLELIGDPSGIKPLSDALTRLGTLSDENLQRFKKENEAAETRRKSTEAHTRSLAALANTQGKMTQSIIAGHAQVAAAEASTYTARRTALNQQYADSLISHRSYRSQMLKLDTAYYRNQNAESAQSAAIRQEAEYRVGQFAIQTAHQVSAAVMDITAQARQNDLDHKLDSLNREKDAELTNKSLTNSQRKAIDEKYKREEGKAKTEAWKADQKAKAETAVINGLLAFTMALAQNPVTTRSLHTHI